jgi:hypothetical protein
LALIVRLIPSFFSTEQRSPRIAVRSKSSLELHLSFFRLGNALHG